MSRVFQEPFKAGSQEGKDEANIQHPLVDPVSTVSIGRGSKKPNSIVPITYLLVFPASLGLAAGPVHVHALAQSALS